MIDTRTDKTQTQETTLLNPLDHIETVSERIAALLASLELGQLRELIQDALKLYQALPQRYIRWGRSGEIQEKLSKFDELVQLTANMPDRPALYLYKQLISQGGTGSTSFITFLLKRFIEELKIYDMTVPLETSIVERLRDLIVTSFENHLRKEEEINQQDKRINEQKQYLQELELSRLKKEEEVLKKKLQIAQYENTLSELGQEKNHRLHELAEFTDKLKLACQQELEKRQELEKISNEKEQIEAKLNAAQADFEMTRKKYKSIHKDFDCKGLSEEQFNFIDNYSEQAVMSAIATVKGKVQMEEDLVSLRARGRVKKGVKLESDVFHKAEEMRLRADKEKELKVVKDTIAAQRNGENEATFNNFKQKLSLQLLLGVNKQAQQDIAKRQQQLLRQQALEKDGFFTVLPENDVMKVDLKEDYLPSEKIVKKFSDIKLKHNFQSENNNFMKAYKDLNRFFGVKNEEKMISEKLPETEDTVNFSK